MVLSSLQILGIFSIIQNLMIFFLKYQIRYIELFHIGIDQ